MNTDSPASAPTIDERVRAEEKRLRAASKQWLRDEWHRHHRVADCRELTKGDLVMDLLRSRFGQRTLSAVYGKKG